MVRPQPFPKHKLTIINAELDLHHSLRAHRTENHIEKFLAGLNRMTGIWGDIPTLFSKGDQALIVSKYGIVRL